MKNIKYIVSAFAVAFLVYIFTFYMDGEMGIILLAFVLFAPLVSLGFAFYARKHVTVTVDCDAYVNKGSKLKVKVNIIKDTVIPLAILEIKPYISEVFQRDDTVYKLSLIGMGDRSFTFETEALYGGNGEIGLEYVMSGGFLGFMRFPIKAEYSRISVGVIPEIPDIKSSSSLVRSIANVVATTENDEDSETSMQFSTNTVPGYEHRKYVQGDPLKRRNWKLSSKKSTLMVRLDEPSASVQPVVVLDMYRKVGAVAEEAIINEEKLLSATFGLLTAIIRQGIACTFVFRNENSESVAENVDNPDYPAQILLKVLACKVGEGVRTDVGALNENVCACIVATTDASGDVTAITDKMGDPDNICILSTSPSAVNSTPFPLWYLDEDNNFKVV